MRREEELIPVLISAEIGTVVGDFEIQSIDVYAVYGGSRVTQVPAGGNFEIHANYQIRNNTAGLTWWTSCMTVFSVTQNSSCDADYVGNHLGSEWKNQADAINWVMPSVATTFRVKIWANQAANAGAPPQSDW